jgi:hypothetical protein
MFQLDNAFKATLEKDKDWSHALPRVMRDRQLQSNLGSEAREIQASFLVPSGIM